MKTGSLVIGRIKAMAKLFSASLEILATVAWAFGQDKSTTQESGATENQGQKHTRLKPTEVVSPQPRLRTLPSQQSHSRLLNFFHLLLLFYRQTGLDRECW